MRTVAWAASAALLLAGCGDEMLSPAPLGDGAGGATLDAPSPPEPLFVTEWRVAAVNAQADPLPAAIDDGSFALPPLGSYLGLSWQAVAPGESGQLVDAVTDYLYAAAVVDVPAGRRLFARGDTVASFWTDNAARQPGDFYHSRQLRVPLAGEGSHLIVARALGRRATPEIELWSSEGELYLNRDDATVPELVEGSSDEQWLGVPLVNLLDEPLADVVAIVRGDDRFAETTVVYPSLAPRATTQLSFRLQPVGPVTPAAAAPLVTLAIESPSLALDHQISLAVPVVPDGSRFRRTRRSGVDGSTQYASVMPPSAVEPGKSYGLILSLHGAGVEAQGQAASYSSKDWAYLVAPTNRRRFGFDWEEWGRLDALEALDDALARFAVDTTRVHLTGHSMGGHGSWHVGVHNAGRFGVVAPSAGWISFEEYTGPAHPEGPLGRARAHSQTLAYVDNFAASSVYIIHGNADDNVPVSHAQQMFATLGPIADELSYHEEPGARHWWDRDANEEGADCVDWEPMIDVMEQRTVDPLPLDFAFRTPAPWVSSRHSFVTVRSAASPMADCAVVSSASGDTVTVESENVRTLELDGQALADAGITTAVIDGTSYSLTREPLVVGPSDGKTPARYGPLNQVFHRPFCLVWDDDGPEAYRHYASFLLSWWSLIGNGQGCGLPLSALDDAVAADHNLVFLGVAPARGLPIDWSDAAVTVGTTSFPTAAVAFVYPEGDRLRAYLGAASGSERLLFRYVPFSSRAGMPDWFVLGADGLLASGFFDADWAIEPAFSEGL